MGNKPPPIEVFHGVNASIKVPYSTEFIETALNKTDILKIEAKDKHPKVVLKQCYLLLKYQFGSLDSLETFELHMLKMKFFHSNFKRLFKVLSQCPNLKLFVYRFYVLLSYPNSEFFTSFYLFMSEKKSDKLNIRIYYISDLNIEHLNLNKTVYLLLLSARFVHNVFACTAGFVSTNRCLHLATTSVDNMNRNSCRKRGIVGARHFGRGAVEKRYFEYCKLVPIFSLTLGGSPEKFPRNSLV